MYPGRTSALCAALFPYQLAGASVYYLLSKTLQDVHGYTPGQVTALYLIGGTVGITGHVVAGRLADRIGRKRVMVAFVIGFATAAAAFYNSSGWLLPPMWIGMTFTNTGVSVMFSALGAELFPTSYRSTASGLRGLVGALGSISGLFAESALYAALGSHTLAITALLPLAAVAACILAWFVPETARRELEAIAPER
jgi:MFS family permease